MEKDLLPHQVSLAQCQAAMVLEGRECANPAEHHQFIPQFRWEWLFDFKPGKAGVLKFYLNEESEPGLALVNEDAFLVKYQGHTYKGAAQKDYSGEAGADTLEETVNRTLEDWLFHRADWASTPTQRSQA
jgi:hypothetical protein